MGCVQSCLVLEPDASGITPRATIFDDIEHNLLSIRDVYVDHVAYTELHCDLLGVPSVGRYTPAFTWSTNRCVSP